ncbi:hypothetical protein [Nocardia niwae]|uniref:hypothetical protein n=1 Tax=Nocardia niwae TaxID=626084 RepID=UPI0007A4B27D|nr:hypothetical protein [Nocardia niwae]
MEPERDSPYWDAIVGDNWPAISPGDWSALERLARDGAGALDLLDADRRRRDFDESARSSAGLQPVKNDMVRQGMNPQAFADALEAAADTFRDFSDLVYRTRNKILDIVEEATARVNATKRAAAAEDDESDAQAIRSRIPGMISAAREDVEDVVRAALSSISPQGLPSLGLIADALGQPGPWGPGHRNATDHSGNDHGAGDRGQHRPATDHSGDPRHNGSPRTDRPKDDTPVVVIPENVDEQPVVDTADPSLPGDEVGREPDPRTNQDTSTEPPATDPVPGQYPPSGTTAVPVSHTPGGATDAGPGLTTAGGPPRAQLTDTEPIASDRGVPADGGDHDAPGSDAQDSHGRGSDVSVDEAESGTRDRSTTVSSAETHAAAAHEQFTDVAVSAADPAASVAPPFVLPPPVVTPGYLASPAPAASAASSGPSGPAVSAPAAQASSGPPQVQAKQTTAPPGESRAPAAAPKVTAVGAGPPPGAGAAGKTQPPERNEQRADAGKDEADDSDDSMRNVVGAAMTSAAPAFVLGARVDGDLVLARTLLGGVLAAAGDAVLGLGWAVSVMRHQSGIAAFVTSNEGRGWIPAGLYLPREISTPWVWEVTESAWEGVADPARVLAEFGIAWGRKSGARLTAVVSSEEVDAELRRQLGEVPIEGEVTASSAMDFSAPRPSLVDRLELIAAPALVQRAAATPESEIGLRCWELASDAHVRVRSAGLGSPAALGAPAARERILEALRQRREVPQQWWEELRDADDLLTATMLSMRADVSRIPLGELRADRTDGRYASEMSGLRAMVFERRCDELVLLLAEAATRPALRDAMYAHTQIVGHPAFNAPAPTPAAAPARRPTITAGPGR